MISALGSQFLVIVSSDAQEDDSFGWVMNRAFRFFRWTGVAMVGVACVWLGVRLVT